MATARVPLLDLTGHLPDSYAPPSVAIDAGTATDAASAALGYRDAVLSEMTTRLVRATSIAGVVGDGATDCTTALNAWLASPPNGAAGLWFPAGTYVASVKVTTPNLTITGPRSAIIKVPSGATLHDNDAGIRVLADGVTVQGISIDGNRVGNPTINTLALAENSDGIGIYANNVTVRNCHIYNAIGHGIIVWGLSYGAVPAAPRSAFIIDGNIVEGGPYRAAIDVAFNQDAVVSTKGTISNNQMSGNTFVMHSANDVVASGNVCAAGVSIHTDCERITLTGNSCPGQPLSIRSGKDISLTGNLAMYINVTVGTGATRSDRVSLTGNTATGKITITDSDHVTATGNVTPAIEAIGSTQCVIEANILTEIRLNTGSSGITVANNLGTFIAVAGATGATITGNRLAGSADYGIYADGSSHLTISGNVIDADVTGIKLGVNAATTDVIVSENVIIGGTGYGIQLGVHCVRTTVRSNTFRSVTTETSVASAALPTLTAINNANSYGRIIAPPASLMSPGAASAAWSAANRAVFSRFSLTAPATLRYFRFTVGVQSGNIQVGVVKYRPGNPTTSDRVMTSGVIACPAAGTQVIDLGAYAAGPGDYAAFIWSDNTTFTTPWATVAHAQSMRLCSIQSTLATGVDTSATHNESVGWALSGVAIETV